MPKRILLAYDGSEPAQKAFEFALQLLRREGGELTMVTVIRSSEFAVDFGAQNLIEGAQRFRLPSKNASPGYSICSNARRINRAVTSLPGIGTPGHSSDFFSYNINTVLPRGLIDSSQHLPQ